MVATVVLVSLLMTPAITPAAGEADNGIPPAANNLDAFDGLIPTRVEGTASDGLRIQVTYWPLWDAGHDNAPDVRPFNLAPDVLHWTLENYEEFLSWGFSPDWGDEMVVVSIDDPLLYPTCPAACARDGKIKLLSTTPTTLLPWTLATESDSFRRTLGHEMFHLLQERADVRGVHQTYQEGTARLQETLHVYSVASHQPHSFTYAQDHQGCNGYDAFIAGVDQSYGNAELVSDMDLGMALGPFTETGHEVEVLPHKPVDLGPSHGYDSCYFWLAWYGHHGIGPLVRLVEDFHGTGSDWYGLITTAIEAATGAPIVDDYARFAMMALTGRGYTWGPAAGPGPTLDWGAHLDRWAPAVLHAGETATQLLRSGGMMARELGSPGIVSWTGIDTVGYLVRDDGNDATVTAIASGTHVHANANEIVWAVVIHPTADVTTASLKLS